MTELKFDADAMFKDIVDEVLIPSANEAMKRVYDDIQHGLSTGNGKRKSEKDDVHRYIARKNNARSEIVASCASFGWALIESYGSGPKIDLKNEELRSYIGSHLWNPLRHDFRVVGRTKGKYRNFFGEEAESKGTKAGKGIGGWGKGRTPNYAIQNAELRLEAGLKEGGFVQRILDTNMEKFFETTDLNQYFIEVQT